jgi:hypothetical protein
MWVCVHTELPPAAVRATQGSVGARVTFTWIRLARFQFDDEERKKRTEKEIRYLQEITGPHLCRMIAQERFPVLPTGSFGASVLHVFLDGPFTQSTIQLEKLTHGCALLPRVDCWLPFP